MTIGGRIWQAPPCPKCGQSVCARARLVKVIAEHSTTPEQEALFIGSQVGFLSSQWFPDDDEFGYFTTLIGLMTGDVPAQLADDDPEWLASVTR